MAPGGGLGQGEVIELSSSMVGDDCSDGGELVVAQAKPICSGTHSPEDVLGEEDGGASRLRSFV